MKSRVLVGLQFFFIFLMLLPLGTRTIHPILGFAVFAIGLTIGLLAIKEHKKGNFNIRPDIKESCELVTSGVYSFVRHPMYLSVVLSMLGIAIVYFAYYEFLLFTLLVVTLLVKLFYEESLWRCHNSEYEAYIKRTKRLIPFIF